MSIDLHCSQCQKLIRAPDAAGGKRGKCPHCGNSMYIPTQPGEDEEIKMAPLDPDAEQRAEKMRRESSEYAANVGHAGDMSGLSADGPVGVSETAPGEVVDMDAEVDAYVIAMRDSKLEEAEAAATRLKRAGPRAKDHVQALIVDEIPLEVEGVPAPLVSGFLKTLLARLG